MVGEAVRRYFEKLATLAATETSRTRTELARLDRQERTLPAAHDADRISEQLFAEDEARIRRERIAMGELVARLDVTHEALRETLDVALDLTDSIHAACCVADATERRLFNQAFFEQLEVDSEPWGGGDGPQEGTLALVGAGAPAGGRNQGTPDFFLVGGSDVQRMVEDTGIEPVTSCLQSRRSPS